MQRGSTESIQELIHKKKEAKKKQKTEGLSSIDYRKGSTRPYDSQEPKVTGVNRQQDNRQQQKSRTRNQIINEEIDELLFSWITEGLVDENYSGFFAKACHVLGTTKMNQLAINSRNGKQPQRLFAYKVKGALSLFYKRQYLNMDSGDNSRTI